MAAKILKTSQRPGSVAENDGTMLGMSLIEASIKSDPKGLIPGPVSLLCDYIVEHGLEVEGVFRKAGSSRRINELLENICECFLKPDGGGMDAAKAIVGGDEGTNKASMVHDVANALLRYLRALPEPLLTSRLVPAFAQDIKEAKHEPQIFHIDTKHTIQAVSDYNAHVLACAGKAEAEKEQILLHQIQVLIKLLPACNRATLIKVVEMCEQVAMHSDVNMMTPNNIGVCIGLTVANPYTLEFIINRKDEVLFGALRNIKVDRLEKAMAGLDISSTRTSLQGTPIDHKPSLHTLNASSIGADALESMLQASMSTQSSTFSASAAVGNYNGNGQGNNKKSVLRRAFTVFRRTSACEADSQECDGEEDATNGSTSSNKRVSSIF